MILVLQCNLAGISTALLLNVHISQLSAYFDNHDMDLDASSFDLATSQATFTYARSGCTVAERRWADFDISAQLQWVCSHICGADVGGSAISWGQRWFGARGFKADAENWVLDPFVAERILLPLRLRSTTAYVWTYVMICVEANFPPASARVRSAHVWTYHYRHIVWYNMIPSYQYRNFHYEDNMVAWPSYLYDWNPIPGKTVFILKWEEIWAPREPEYTRASVTSVMTKMLSQQTQGVSGMCENVVQLI